MRKTCIALLILIALIGICGASVQKTTITENESNTIRVGNPFIEIVFHQSRGTLTPVSLVNKISQTRYPLGGDFFEVLISYPGAEITPDPETPSRLTMGTMIFNGWESTQENLNVQNRFHFSGKDVDIFLTLGIPTDKPFFHTGLEIINLGSDQLFLEKAIVLSLNLGGAQLTLGGFGQPVYGEDIFFGVEYPSAYNEFIAPDNIICWHRIGEVLPAGKSYQSQKTVVGVTPVGDVQSHFFDYIATLRPRPDEPFLLYNTWYDIRNFSPENIKKTIDAFKETLVDRYELELDAFVIDDGWDNFSSLWEIDKKKFPDGLGKIAGQLRNVSKGLGLWISPWGGYDLALKERVASASRNGYETCGIHLCMGGDKYYDVFQKKVLEHLDDGDLSFLKIDGFLSLCNEINHAHLPGIYSRPFLTNRFIDFLTTIRKNKPDIFIDITVGTWLSPWWLQYADAVWMTGADFGHSEDVPAISERDKAITFRDHTLYKDFVRDRIQFPLSNVMTHGIIKGRLNMLGGESETLDNWKDNTIMYFSRGVMMWELYISPDVLSEAEWDFMAGVIKWARGQKNIFKHTRFIGGDPNDRAIYGYVHEAPDEVWVIVRNPFVAPQSFEISMDMLAKTSGFEKLMVEEVYPHHRFNSQLLTAEQSLKMDLAGYEARILRFHTSFDMLPPLLGDVLITGLDQEGEKVSYTVALDPVGNVCPQFTSADKPAKLSLNGQVITTDELQRLMCKQQKYGSEDLKASISIDRMNSAEVSGKIRWQGEQLEFEGQMGLLLDFEEIADSIHITINHPESQVRKGAEGKWYWVLFPMDSTQQEITFTLKSIIAANFPPGRLSIWAVGNLIPIPVGRLDYMVGKKRLVAENNVIPLAQSKCKFTKQLFNCDFIR